MSESKSEYVTITMSDGATMDIPAKEVPFEKSETTASDLEAVVTTEPFAGSNESTTTSMPQVDVTSDVTPLTEEQIKATKSFFQRWREKAEQEKLFREAFVPDKFNKWRSSAEEKRVIKEKASKAAHIWKEFINERRSAKQLIQNQLMKKVQARRAKKKQQLEESTQSTDTSVKPSTVLTTVESVNPNEQVQSDQMKVEETTTSELEETRESIEDRRRKTSSPIADHLRATVKKVAPKVVMMKRKNAPPILSLPGEEKKVKAPPATQSTGESKEKLSPLRQPPPVSADAASGDGGGGDDGGGGSGGTGSEEDKKGKLKKPMREFEIGAPQRMAGQIALACRKNDWNEVERLLKLIRHEGLDINLVSEVSGWSPVHYATKENRLNILEKLLDIGYNVNAKAKDGTTPLHVAVLYAREDTIRTLLLRGADTMIPAGPKSQIPLHLIASKSQANALVPMQLLLRSSPKEIRTFVDGHNNIPLFTVIEVQNQTLARELLADYTREQLTFARTDTGETAVFIATRKKDLDMLRLLVDLGADVNVQNVSSPLTYQ